MFFGRYRWHFFVPGRLTPTKADSYGNEKLKRKWPKFVLFCFLEPKIWSESILWQRFCFGVVSTTSLSLSVRGRFKNEIAEWKWPLIFQNKRARYARADELEIYSSISTTLPMKRRHQPMSTFYSSCSCIVRRWKQAQLGKNALT